MNRKSVLLWLLASAVVALLATTFASRSPDGLEWVAEKFGFIEMAKVK